MASEDVEKTEVDDSKNDASFEAVSMPSKSNSRSSKPMDPDFSKIPDTSRLTKFIFWIVVIVVVAFLSGWVGARVETRNGAISPQTAKEIVTSKNQLISAIVANDSPSVVSIDATGTTQSQNIFGLSQPQQVQSAGTGIIISSSGYILTNRHVIPAGATSVTVVLADGTTVNNVAVIGTTPQSDSLDVAILKISNSPETLQPAVLGDSSKVQDGDQVVAIGNALGQFQNTVTSGIISGRGRTIQAGDSAGTTSEDLQDLFQTDAAINEGNSGGPLIATNGEVIGLNTATASSAQNIGFSIPINDVEGIIKGVFSTGKIERPYLGVYYVAVNPSVQKQYNLTVKNGAYIPPNQSGQSSIISGSPASDAGLQPGDVITAVNGVNIDNNNSLSSLIDQNPVGTKVSLTIVRSGSTKDIPITIGQEPNGN
jgi:serine protease Do